MSNFLPESLQVFVPDTVQIVYIIAITLFIYGLKKLSSPATARNGNLLAALGMFLGVIVTLLDRQIVSFEYIIVGIIVGSLIGVVSARKVKMTAMPEMVAIFNGFGGAASALVAVGEYMRTVNPATLAINDLVTLGLSVLVGAVTFTGSFIAFGKLRGFVAGKPIVYAGQKIVSGIIGLIILGSVVMLVIEPASINYLWINAALSLILGILLVIPIGGADMPVVIALLNSYSGIAAMLTGFVLNNNLLIVSGALVGASGIILSNIMCQAMNRSLGNVLFGAFGSDGTAIAGGGDADYDKSVREAKADDVAVMTAYAQRVVVVPGYGLAVAQAQHVIREVANLLEEKGVDVKYGIHPVAGRMPGHMNVLLAEANVPYPQLYDMDDINPEFERTDVVLVIGANDVVNPAARTNPGSPIYGMPILNVDEAKTVVVLKRSLNPGFAGIDNELFYKDNTYMFFGDAKKSLTALASAIKEL
ncbi:MAG TPA: NAD(P)(+) transhydrogenase (Re/Si-specific) subunit beta [Balneolales bacterium]|nr:NAD(P)(+) transhydrogenase (Re/Si-specific) subunit beta [Balneolales bacterium]